MNFFSFLNTGFAEFATSFWTGFFGSIFTAFTNAFNGTVV